ncbi:MAG: class I SAM-dependent methyltransferase [Candidatus Limnocylindrales bacterium]
MASPLADLESNRTALVTDESSPDRAVFGNEPIVAVALRREAAHRVASLPPDLARGILVVTTVAGNAGEAPLPDGPVWQQVDPERGFREARGRLGGSLPAVSVPRRLLRTLRHPVRTVRRRSLYQQRSALRTDTLTDALRTAIAAAGADGAVTVWPLEPPDADLVRSLAGQAVRLVSWTPDGLVAAWEAAGRPRLETPSLATAPRAYDPAAYWGGLHQRHDLSAVGQSGLPPGINAWLYRSLARTLRGFLRRNGVTSPASAFDVGIGTGYWVRFWRSLGASVVDGCDLVPEAVDDVRRQARAAGAKGTYVTADIGVAGSLPQATYLAVSCMNVLLHLTDDAAFDRALAGIAALVAPGGVLVLAEPMLLDARWERPYDPGLHSRARPAARYRETLEAAGLVLEDLRAGTVLANNPIEAGSRRAYARYARWWRWVASESKANPGSAGWLGPLVMLLDRVALPTGASPSTKLALFRRPRPGERQA